MLAGGTATDLLDVYLGEVTAALAESPYEIFTTDEPAQYFSAQEFFGHLRNVEALESIARRGAELLRGVPDEYREAPEGAELGPGHEVVAALNRIVGVEAKGVHVEHEVIDEATGEVVDGIVTAESMTFYCSDADEAQRLRARLRPLLQTVDSAYSHDVWVAERDDGRVGVVINQPNEYTLRELGSTLAAIVAVEKGISPQEVKLSLADRKARGETFSPKEEQALIVENEIYTRLKDNISATYYSTKDRSGRLKLIPRTNRDLLTRDIPALQIARDMTNALIRTLPGRRANQEQHPNPAQRLASHGVVELTRYEWEADAQEGWYRGIGPSLARIYTTRERLRKRLEKFSTQRKRDIAFAAGAMLLKLIAEGRGAALELALDVVQEAQPHAGSVVKRARANYHAWREHNQKTDSSRERALDALFDLISQEVFAQAEMAD